MAGKSLRMFLLLASISVLINSSVCSEESVAMTKAKDFTDNAKAFAEGVEKLISPENTRIGAQLIKEMLGSLSASLGPIVGIFGMVATLLTSGDSAELTYMKEAFAEVDRTLSRIEDSLDRISTKISWQTVQLSFEDDENDILTIHQDMRKTLQALTDDTASTSTKEYTKKVFMDKFESRDVEGALNTLYNGIMTKCTMCQGKILDILKDNAMCDRKEVVAFMTSLLQVFVKGEQAVIAYHQWTGEEGSTGYVERLTNSWTQMHDDLEVEYGNTLEYCTKNFASYMKDEVELIAEQNPESTRSAQDVANMIQQHVSTKYDWLEFSVMVYKRPVNFDADYVYDCGNDYYGSNHMRSGKTEDRLLYIGWREKTPLSASSFENGRQVLEDAVNGMYNDKNKRPNDVYKEVEEKLTGFGLKCRYILAFSDQTASKRFFFVNATESDGTFHKEREASWSFGYNYRYKIVVFGINE